MIQVLEETKANSIGGSTMPRQQDAGGFRRTKLSDIVVEHIVSGIKNATYLPGQKINPHDVARQLDVSIMPVRDALERLEQQEWVVRYSQRGTYIRRIRIGRIREMADVRAMVESESIIRVIEECNSCDLSGLEEVVASNNEALLRGDIVGYEQTDTIFHKKLVELTGNKKLIDMHGDILERTEYAFLILIMCSGEMKEYLTTDLPRIPVSHESIYEAIKARELIAALKLIREHINKSVERWDRFVEMEYFDTEGFFEKC